MTARLIFLPEHWERDDETDDQDHTNHDTEERQA